MKILYVNHYAGSLSYGMEYRPFYMAREWVRAGHQVRIVAADRSHIRAVTPDLKQRPRMVSRAKDMHYFTPEGKPVLDGAAGLWCTNAGHGRTQISDAIGKMAATLDYAPPFQFGIPQAFELASRIADLAPKGLDHVFFCNSGSEAADTALKIALAYHQLNGQGARSRLIGRVHELAFGNPDHRSSTARGGALAANVALFVGGLFEYNFGDSEFLMLLLLLITLPFAAGRPTDDAAHA